MSKPREDLPGQANSEQKIPHCDLPGKTTAAMKTELVRNAGHEVRIGGKVNVPHPAEEILPYEPIAAPEK